jgi:ADP-dependent glucokinase
MNYYLLFVVIIAIFISSKRKPPPPEGSRLHLLTKLHSNFIDSGKCDKSLVLGWNTCIDLLVNASKVSNDLQLSFSETNDHESISSLKTLQESLGYWFSKGGAAERLMSGQDAANVFKEVVESSKLISDGRIKIGGNAALMATSLAKFGCSVHLGGVVGTMLADRLNPSIQISTPTSTDNQPIVDPVHLILEYQKDQILGREGLIAPRANRYILVHDPLNAQLAGLEPLRDHLRKTTINNRTPYDVFVASGLNQLEALTPVERNGRLRAVRSAIYELPEAMPVHLELASMSDPSFVKSMAATMFPVADSFGLNEEELAFTFESLGGWFVDDTLTTKMLTGKIPNVNAVVEAIEFLLKMGDEWSAAARSGNSKNVRSISRVHFHALSYHIIAERNVEGREKWSSTFSKGVAAGSVIATLNACGKHPEYKNNQQNPLLKMIFPNYNDYPKEDDLELLYNETCTGQVHAGVCVWKHGTTTFSLAPVLVAKHPVNTVGLGDSISASGLLHSL